MSPSIAVVTALSKGYDQLWEPPEAKEVAFVAYTDGERTPKGWSRRQLPEVTSSNKRNCLFVKTHFFDLLPDYNCVLWTDARLELLINPIRLLPRFPFHKAPLWTFKHPWCNNLKDEIDAIRERNLVPRRELADFEARLTQHDLEGLAGHSETGVMLAYRSKSTVQFFRAWWEEIENAPPRDQLTFDISRRKVSGLGFCYFDDGKTDAKTCDFIDKGKHVKKSQRPERSYFREWSVAGTEPRSEPNDPESLNNQSEARRTLDIIIPANKIHEVVFPCLARALESDCVGRVILALNGPKVEASAIVEHFAVSQNLQVIQTTDELGYAGSCNWAMQYAGEEIVLFLNSDCVLGTHATRNIVDAFEDERFALIGGVGFGTVDYELQALGGRWEDRQRLVDLASVYGSTFLCDERAITQVVHGSALAVRRSAFVSVNGFDDGRFPRGYGEELDLALRLAREGWLSAFHPGVVVNHVGGMSFGDERESLKRKGRVQLCELYGVQRVERFSEGIRANRILRTFDADLEHYIKRFK